MNTIINNVNFIRRLIEDGSIEIKKEHLVDDINTALNQIQLKDSGLFRAVTEWQKETFKGSTANSKLTHLEQEIIELKDAIAVSSPDKRLEFADCFILLYGAAAAEGMNYEDICIAITDKMMINQIRQWGKPDENGLVNHIK